MRRAESRWDVAQYTPPSLEWSQLTVSTTSKRIATRFGGLGTHASRIPSVARVVALVLGEQLLGKIDDPLGVVLDVRAGPQHHAAQLCILGALTRPAVARSSRSRFLTFCDLR